MTIKKVFFEEEDEQHARMLVRLRYDRLTQGNFFRGLVEMYVNNDLDMIKIIVFVNLIKSFVNFFLV